jgi:hypothetical protein
LKQALFILFLAGGAFLANANQVDPSAVVTLDHGSPTKDGSDWDWTYTVTVSNGDLSDIRSFEIFDVYGVVGVSAPWLDGWGSSYHSIGGGYYDVTFTNYEDPCYDCTLDGFTIKSTSGVKTSGDYTVNIDCDIQDSSTVGIPKAATPEPASVSLIGLPLLGLAGLKFRDKRIHNAR